MSHPANDDFKEAEQVVINEAAAIAQEAFWKAIAEHFPKAESGDLDCSASFDFGRAAEAAVGNWYAWNVAQEGAS